MQKYILFIMSFFLLVGCSKQQPESDVSLKEVPFSELQGFDADDMLGAYKAFRRSCEAVSLQSGEYLGKSAIKINRNDYLTICAKSAGIMPAKFKDFIKDNFVPYLVTYKKSSEGKFTAYYEAELKASYQRDDVYKYPVYGRPYDLIELNLQDFDPTLPNKKLIGRVDSGKLVPYYTREHISKNGANAPVILWADSNIDIYVMQIQGSAVAHMKDGSKIRISYANSNGRPFRGIGSILLSKGLVKPGNASMGSIKKWLRENPSLAEINMNENERYIFHRLGNPEGPLGAQGVPLTAGRSLAVDKSFVPLGALLWLETSLPGGTPMSKLVVAQDIGSAIKGAVRGDYFWGSGGDNILEEAGKMNSKGQYYILIPKHSESVNGQENK